MRVAKEKQQSGFSSADMELVELERDHPGFNDQVYRARRNQIAHLAGTYVAGGHIPSIDYNGVEQSVWKTVLETLAPLHEERACRAYLEGREAFGFDPDDIPSFDVVNRRLEPLCGYTLAPVAGLVLPIHFLTQLGERRFLATQYMRHHSVPLYTPEPDVIHEYVGHIPTLSQPDMAALNYAFGAASMRTRDEGEITALIRVYWYTIEFGLVEEDGEVKAYGAGLLSSFGELGNFQKNAELRPWDIAAMAARPYDPTEYQSQLFVAPSFAQMRDDLHAWLDSIAR